MGNVATTVEEQIQKLRNREMHIEDEEKCKEMLLDIGYYRLGFYWNYFERTDVKEHRFKPGADFKHVSKLYYLDADLRHLLLKYIYRIEVNFRTQVIYHVSNNVKSPTWFIDPKTVHQEGIDYIVGKYDSNFINNNITLKRHHAKYINDKYAPAWKTIEYIPFNGVLKLYKNLKDPKLKQLISDKYNIRKVSMFENFMTAIVFVRNMCSHSGVIFDLKQPMSLSTIPGHKPANMNSLWASILAIKFIMKQISVNRYDELCEAIKEIFARFEDDAVLKEIITNKIGYEYSVKNSHANTCINAN